MIRTFVETRIFRQLVDQLSNKELEKQIKDEILKDPQIGDVIQGTGGLRKLRLSDKNGNKGKRGGFRVIYLDIPKKELTYLIFIYPKNIKSDLSHD
jgi:mRNA-degrading endonuclease RelE of RelBE toxin-antitoxin system